MSSRPTRRGAVALALIACLQTLAAEETILQYFNTSWPEIEGRIPEIAEAGYTSLWLPPPFKGASGTFSVGFDSFDRFDLGDKDQMGTVPTRYGTRAELLSLIRVAHRFGIKVYFDNVMAHNGGPLDGGTAAGQLFPGLPGFVPEDFHLGREGGGWRKFSDSINYGDEWQVLNRNPFGWDIAQEDWNTSFDAFGLLENNDYPKWRGLRHPGKTEYYLDDDLPVATDFFGNPVYTFADKEPFDDVGYGSGNIGAGNGRFDWDDVDGDGQHDAGETSEPFTDTGVDPGNPDRRNATWGHGDGVYNMGDPVDEDVNAMLIRQVRWFMDVANADGLRLDAVKHVPSYFFGEQNSGDKDKSGAGYNGQIQEQFNVSRGFTDWGNHRDSVFTNTLTRDDALLYGEHLGAPPPPGSYHAAGMRIANDDFLNSIGGFNGIGGNLSGYDGPNYGTYGGTSDAVAYPLSHDNNFMDGSIRGAAHGYLLTREGLPIVYTDGYNIAGAPDYFPKPSYVPFLGQYGQRWVTGPLAVRRDFVRGGQHGRWSDNDFAAWEMRDSRENPSMSVPDSTVLLVMMARGFTGGQARDFTTTFPGEARLRNYSEHGGPFMVTVGLDGRVRDDSLNFPVVPSGGYFAFSWDNPRQPSVWEGDGDVRPIEILQGGARAPLMEHPRRDGRDGDPAYAHDASIFRVTDGSDLSFVARADGSAANILMRLDGGVDINSQLGLGPASGDRRDNPPPKDNFFAPAAADIFTGYEQMRFVDRTVEKFAAADVARNVVGSAGAETWGSVLGSGSFTRSDGGGPDTDTGTVDWVYHDPGATDDSGNPQFVHLPGLQVEIRAKIGYTDDDPAAAWVYYTTDGTSFPEGSLGVGKGATQVAAMGFGPFGTPDPGGTPEWWEVTLPAVPAGTLLRYKIGVHRASAPDRFPFSQNDIDIKRRMETQFEITGFDAAAAAHYPHNDHGEMAVGLEEGFHILRTRAFLGRSGHASIFRTEAQTFYYDTRRPEGQVLFPRAGDRIGGSAYGAVAISDASVTSVCFNILDSDPANDSAGSGNGAGNWAQATEVRVPSQLGGSGLAREWRFDYRDIPTSSTAEIYVRFKETSSSADNSLTDEGGHYTTIKVDVDTGFPVNYRFGFPAADGETVGEGYVAKVLFDKSLGSGVPDAQLLGEFVFTAGGQALDPSQLAIVRNETANEDALAATLPNLYDGAPATLHELRAVHTRGDITLTDLRLVRAEVAALPDSDGDGLPDFWEQLHGLDANNPTGVHGANGDFDGDGVTNLGEYLAGTNPLTFEIDGFAIHGITPAGAGAVQLRFPVVADRHYRVLYSSDLASWTEAASFDILTGNPDFLWVDDGSLTGSPPSAAARRYYQIEISMPQP